VAIEITHPGHPTT